MNYSSVSQLPEKIRHARTVRGIPPDQYLVAERSIGELLERQAAAFADKTFLFYHNDDNGEQAQWTFKQLDRRVNQLANLLREAYGVGRGDKVATLAYNHPDAVIACFACWKLGAVATPQNAAEDDSRIAFILQNAGCKVMLAAPEYAARGIKLKAQSACLENVIVMDADYQRRLDACEDKFTLPTAAMLEEQALLVYTSGTTGAPKGVMLSQYNLLCDCKSGADWQRLNRRCAFHVCATGPSCQWLVRDNHYAALCWRFGRIESGIQSQRFLASHCGKSRNRRLGCADNISVFVRSQRRPLDPRSLVFQPFCVRCRNDVGLIGETFH